MKKNFNSLLLYTQQKTANIASLFIGILLITAPASVKGQNDFSAYYSHHSQFSSSRLESKNIIKTDILAISRGELPLIWEHRFSETFSLQGGPGVLLPYNTHFLSLSIGSKSNKDFKNKELGYSMQLAPRFYFKNSPKNYLDFIFEYKRYEYLGVFTTGIAKGWAWPLFDRLKLDTSVDLTLSWQNQLGEQESFLYDGGSLEDSGRNAIVCMTFHVFFGIPLK